MSLVRYKPVIHRIESKHSNHHYMHHNADNKTMQIGMGPDLTADEAHNNTYVSFSALMLADNEGAYYYATYVDDKIGEMQTAIAELHELLNKAQFALRYVWDRVTEHDDNTWMLSDDYDPTIVPQAVRLIEGTEKL